MYAVDFIMSSPPPYQATQPHCPTCRTGLESVEAVELQDVLDATLELLELVELIALRVGVPRECLDAESST